MVPTVQHISVLGTVQMERATIALNSNVLRGIRPTRKRANHGKLCKPMESPVRKTARDA